MPYPTHEDLAKGRAKAKRKAKGKKRKMKRDLSDHPAKMWGYAA